MNETASSRPLQRDEAVAIVRAHESELRSFRLRSLVLFGSTARNETGQDSDVDFLVEFDGPATFDRYMGLKILLEDLLDARVDLVTRKALKNENLIASIERDAIRVA